MDIFSLHALATFMQVVAINLVLSGDNAIVIGLAAAGLPLALRTKAIFFGIVTATVLRIAFAMLATQLMKVTGLQLAGGLLLLLVCWNMWSELQSSSHMVDGEALAAGSGALAADAAAETGTKTFAEAAWQIVVADVSMSLDNVLAVAGAAREHPVMMAFGLVLSIALMGAAAALIARFLNRYPWLSYVGLAVILYVAGEMICRGSLEVVPLVRAAIAA